jgi:phosphate transport system substrate-binding protein
MWAGPIFFQILTFGIENFGEGIGDMNLQRVWPAIALVGVVGMGNPGAIAQGQGTVRVTGSSTVFPISQAIAKQTGNATVEFTGTTGGFQKFCQKQFDITGASRPIRPEEISACRRAGVFFYELPVAFDALTVKAPAALESGSH